MKRNGLFTSAKIFTLGLFFLFGLAGYARGQGIDGTFDDCWGPRYAPVSPQPLPTQRYEMPRGPDAIGQIRYWNQIMLNANALDHTPVAPGESRVFGEQLGPHRTSRAFAIVQIAVFDVVNAITHRYQSYTGLHPAPFDTSVDAAIAQAAHDTLVALYPSQAANFDDRLANDLGQIPAGRAKTNGIDLGRRGAAAILVLRANDGSQIPDPRIGIDFFPSNLPGKWRQDPISMNPLALGAFWGAVKPFVVKSSSQFRAIPPPPLPSPMYTAAYNEVKLLGGDGIITPTKRTYNQTVAGIYWGYEGTPGLGTPPRLYNQIVVQIAGQMRTDAGELARLLALVNTAMADGAIECWETKYYYQFWRPITAIRESDPGTGPTGAGDGNPMTKGDPYWTPLGAQASNLTGPNFTPPFPSYSSGHAVFGGTVFQTLRKFYKTDRIAFTFVSDEFNGVTRDNHGNVRPRIPRSFGSLSQAEEENGQSRIYLGIHWSFDKTQGIYYGRLVADFVFNNAFEPVEPCHGSP